MSSLTLDAVDWRILDVLQQDARIANVDLARRVHLSASPCLARVRKLEQAGLIRRHVTLLDPIPLGLTVSVFIQVRLEKQVERALDTFERNMRPLGFEIVRARNAADACAGADVVTSCTADKTNATVVTDAMIAPAPIPLEQIGRAHV